MCEVVADGGAVLSIVLAGHPKLRNVPLRPNMEEIGSRFAVFPFEGIAGHQTDYIAWLLDAAGPRTPNPPRSSSRRRSICLPCGCARRCRSSNILTRVFEKTFEAGETVVTATLAETVLSADRRSRAAAHPLWLRREEHRRGIPHQAGRRAPVSPGSTRPRPLARTHRADARRRPPVMRLKNPPFPAQRGLTIRLTNREPGADECKSVAIIVSLGSPSMSRAHPIISPSVSSNRR